jgi:hypothetical protein
MYKYSVLTFVFGTYECLREVGEIDNEVEYICVTDNKNLKSNTWKVIVDEDLNGKGVFDKCFSVRYNPFKYCTTDICVRVDGSIKIHKSITPIVDDFIKSGDDVCFLLHPYRDYIPLEYKVWEVYRGFPMDKIKEHITLFNNIGYDFNKKGFIQLNFSIVKRNKINDDINRMTYAFQKLFGNEKDIDRLDQMTITVVLDRFFPNVKVYGVSEKLLHSEYMTWCGHNSNAEIIFNEEHMIKEPHLNGKEMEYNDLKILKNG